METRSRMSRSLHTNRDFEKLEPYEGKPSRTVLRGEEGSNALDLPDRPSDLQQRDGRGIRKGNEVAKLYADNKVDVIIYAVEKSLDSYKFNLLYNKQLFITQLKQNNMGCRTIDEGGMDEKGGIPFSEYVAVLSGNTDLLDKARLEKRIAGMEGERKAFQRGKGESRIKLETFLANRTSNDDIIARVRKDKAAIESRMQYDKEGNRLNPLKIDGVAGDDPKVIAAKLHEIEDRERTASRRSSARSMASTSLSRPTPPSRTVWTSARTVSSCEVKATSSTTITTAAWRSIRKPPARTSSTPSTASPA